MRDHAEDYDAAGAVVLGVSPDPVAAVKRFHDKQGLNFTLLADEDHAVAEAYGVWVEKSMYGRTYLGNERTTFVLDEDGTVTDVLRKVKPEGARRARARGARRLSGHSGVPVADLVAPDHPLRARRGRRRRSASAASRVVKIAIDPWAWGSPKVPTSSSVPAASNSSRRARWAGTWAGARARTSSALS